MSFRKKYLPALICGHLTLLVLCGDHTVEDNIMTDQKFNGSKTLGEKEPNFRRSRSVRGITSPILKALINTATEVSTSSVKFRKFVKHGSEGDAIADFYKLRPKSIRVSRGPEETHGSAGGFVDGTDVQLRIRKRWPAILIYTKDAGAIKISYIRKIPDNI